MYKYCLKYGFSLFHTPKPKSCYDILEVSRGATSKDIKLKYIELVKKYHPDHNKDSKAEEQFKEIVKAYQTLKDPIKRQLYDSDPFSFDKSGTSSSANEVNSESGHYYSNPNKAKEFYDNKWYQYQKPKYETLHDEYKTQYEYVDEMGSKAIITRALMIVLAYLIWDGYRFIQRKRHDKFLSTQKEILDSQFKDAPIEKYIDQRQQEHQLEI